MRKILKTIGVCFITCLAFSCKSDDDVTSEKNTFLVLEKVEQKIFEPKEDDDEWIGMELDTEGMYIFYYGENGQIESLETSGQTDIYYQAKAFKTLTKVFYTDANQVSRLYVVDLMNNLDLLDETFTYDGQGLQTMSVDRVEHGTKTYLFNGQKQLTSLFVKDLELENTINFEYDTNGNVKRAFDPLIPDEAEEFTYDTKKSPYENMALNMSNENFESLYDVITLKMAKNNVVSYNDFDGDLAVEYEYNKEGYPTKATAYYKHNKSFVRSIQLFSYREISLKK